MDWDKIEQWVEFGIIVAREVSKLTPNELDDRLPEVMDAIWRVLRPTFASNGHAPELTEAEAELVGRMIHAAPLGR